MSHISQREDSGTTLHGRAMSRSSGGVAVNIGFHLFDILVHVFGRPTMVVTHLRDHVRAAGFLLCERASVRWFSSCSKDNDLPLNNGSTSHRSINIDGEEIEFSDGFAKPAYAELRGDRSGKRLRTGRSPAFDRSRRSLSFGGTTSPGRRAASDGRQIRPLMTSTMRNEGRLLLGDHRHRPGGLERSRLPGGDAKRRP